MAGRSVYNESSFRHGSPSDQARQCRVLTDDGNSVLEFLSGTLRATRIFLVPQHFSASFIHHHSRGRPAGVVEPDHGNRVIRPSHLPQDSDRIIGTWTAVEGYD